MSSNNLFFVCVLTVISCSTSVERDDSDCVREQTSPFQRYEQAADASTLRMLVDADLSHGKGKRAYEGLEAFTRRHVLENHGTRGHLTMIEARVVSQFMFSDAQEYMGAVKELGNVLQHHADRELDEAYAAVRIGDTERLSRMTEDAHGLFHPTTVAMSVELLPHAALANAMLSYHLLSSEAEPDEVDAVLATLVEARRLLVNSDRPEGLFLAGVATAQTFEISGREDEAAELWLGVADSPVFGSAPPSMRNAIAARIVTYRQRLRNALAVELEGERRAELEIMHNRYEAELVVLRRSHREFEEWVRADSIATKAALQRLSSSEGVEVWDSEDFEWLRVGVAVVSFVADVFTVLRPVRRLLRIT